MLAPVCLADESLQDKHVIGTYIAAPVSRLSGRLFAAWTSVTCMLTLGTAYDLKNTTVYGKGKAGLLIIFVALM